MDRANFSSDDLSNSTFSSYQARQFDERNKNGGKPVLQHCEDCGAVQYPSREVCRSCLSGALVWKPIDDDSATVVSNTLLHHSLEEHYLERLPWHVVAVRPSLNFIGSMLVHSAKPWSAGEKVRLVAVSDYRGASSLLAVSPDDDADAIWQQLSQSEQR